MKKIYDYKVKGRKRERCPKCGKLGVKRVYESEYPAGIFLHKYRVGSLDGVIEIVESCSFGTHKELLQERNSS